MSLINGVKEMQQDVKKYLGNWGGGEGEERPDGRGRRGTNEKMVTGAG